MPLDIAALENSFKDKPEPEPETPEAEETPEEEAPEAQDEALEVPDDSDEPEEETEETDLSELAAEAKYKIGDKELTGKEIEAGMLRQEDYTRKTQAIAEERRSFQAEIEELKDENEEFKDWVGSLGDVDTLRFELARYFPQTLSALRDYFISEALEEQDMSESERAWKRRAEQAEVDRRAREQDEARQGKINEKKAMAQKTNELRQTFDGWLKETMAACGLDPEDRSHQKLLRNEIAGSYRGKTWTKDVFMAAAKDVAKALGKKPGEKKPAPKEKAKDAPPAMRPAGHKAPSQAKAQKKAESKAKIGTTEDYFQSLRDKYGTR